MPDVNPHDWRSIVAPVESFLAAVAQCLEDQVEAFEPEIVEYARYALTSQGKQLRPALVALSATPNPEKQDDLVLVAAIIEMVHLATLVHDDVMDHAELRRKRPTLAANWGNHISVLLGDCLFAHSLKLAASFPTPEICRAVAQASKTVCSGEILQTNRGLDFNQDREDYFKILGMKTAEFFALSCDMGSHLSQPDETTRTLLRKFGYNLGVAYQIYDDCVDVFSSDQSAGKTTRADLAGGKITLPSIVLLERANPDEKQNFIKWARQWENADIEGWSALLEKYEVQTACEKVIHDWLEKARKNLNEAALRCPKNHYAHLMAVLSFLEIQIQQLHS
ncbi:polyprenyl synthetase family protein [Verrucomicrobia bacterium]|nr:polyprenyl synthetase family protein [Verrucomicrobiota bacterium]